MKLTKSKARDLYLVLEVNKEDKTAIVQKILENKTRRNPITVHLQHLLKHIDPIVNTSHGKDSQRMENRKYARQMVKYSKGIICEKPGKMIMAALIIQDSRAVIIAQSPNSFLLTTKHQNVQS